ncbi:MAG: ferrous iron transport protein B [Planctomycetota bacterium]|jgi:ferrous iron transport protein B|nr:ferrous iron transport protein B [Planctomycetota bacterium]
MPNIVVALAGNPNSGKTTVFNALTGLRQHVGNYPGVTVEKKEGAARRNGGTFTIVDLPGTYSLSASSPEEVVARNFLVDEKPDVVVQVLDASNLERNLYLAVQMMELGVKMAFALNMSDVAKARGIEFDLDKLSGFLKAPVVPTVGNKGQGTDALLDAAARVAGEPVGEYEKIKYPHGVREAIERIECMLTGKDGEYAARFPDKWLAARILEGDNEIVPALCNREVAKEALRLRESLEAESGDFPEITMAEARYGWISGMCSEAVRMTPESRHEVSDTIDRVLLNRVLGLPIFLILMYIVFQLVFTLAEPPMEWIENAFGALGSRAAGLWPKAADSPLRELLVDGIIGGVGGVLVFLPNIILLFLAIAFLEGTGYMARAAFLMDRLMHKIGLHGKSFIPMLLGFGCTVPAIMGTRTLENRQDRLTTILVLPWMSCGARLPIYALIIPAFFPEALHAWMLWLIYVIGIVFAVVGARLLRTSVFKGDSVPFVMELPPYRIPTLRAVITLMWDRAGEYVKKAGTIILGVSIVLWAMTAYPKKPEFDRDYAAAREAVVAGHMDAVAELGTELGLGQEGSFLREWEEAKLEMAGVRDEYWEKESGYVEGERVYEAKLEQLFNQPGGARLREFADADANLEEMEAAFAEETEGLEEGSREYREAERRREAAIAAIAIEPGLFAGVAAYRDDIAAGYGERMGEIDNAEAGEELAHSISGRIGKFLEPVVRPMGFDWRIATAIIGSFAAKEVFVAQMGIVYSVGEADEESDSLRDKLCGNYTPLQGFCMMLYSLLSLPCVATIAVARRETGGWKLPIAMIVGFTLVAYVATTIVYQFGSAFGIGM